MPLWLVICGLGITQIIGWGTTYYALGALSQDIAAPPAGRDADLRRLLRRTSAERAHLTLGRALSTARAAGA